MKYIKDYQGYDYQIIDNRESEPFGLPYKKLPTPIKSVNWVPSVEFANTPSIEELAEYPNIQYEGRS